MSQHDLEIENQGFAATRADINSALAALATCSSGATGPTTTYAYQLWADTGSTPPMLRLRNSANNEWLPIGPLADLGIQTGAQSLASVGGTADALTLTFFPALTALHGGIFQFVAAADNTTATPTGNLSGLGAKTFIKGNNLALAPGDIKSGMTMLARYDSALGKLVLLNPFTSMIIETGSNANGTYTKWADGTMICEHRQTASASIGNAFTGGGFYSGGITWTFPAAFVAGSIPICTVTAYGLASFGAVISITPVNTELQYVHLSIGSLGGADRYAMLTAKGRWY